VALLLVGWGRLIGKLKRFCNYKISTPGPQKIKRPFLE
jgi:hypothetical protein